MAGQWLRDSHRIMSMLCFLEKLVNLKLVAFLAMRKNRRDTPKVMKMAILHG
jgi:hypothetical protein